MVIGEHHAIAQAALAESGFEVRHALVAVFGIVLARSDRRSLFASARLVLAHAEVGDLRLAIDHAGHAALHGIMGEFDAFGHFFIP